MTLKILSDAVREVALADPEGTADRPLYNQALRAIRNGRVPVTRVGRNYFVNPENVPALASALGLRFREPADAP